MRILPFLAALVFASSARAEKWLSHEPQRPLPVPSQHPLPAADIRVIDAVRGDDNAAGTEAAPWRTLEHALTKIPSGGVLCLRGGVHYSHAIIRSAASAATPLIIRAWPGELAVIDGGIPEFATSPASAWEPCPGGVPGEFRSAKSHAVEQQDRNREDDGEVLAMGRFIDSMIPLHGARFRGDLQSDNPWWNIDSKTGAASFVYCGPAVWQNPATGRIHCRLAHTKLPGLGADNYTGGTDPRGMPLCIATTATGPALTLKNARHVVLQDLAVRGSATATLLIEDCADVTLDGVTVFGGGKAVQVRDTAGFRMLHSACRGVSAPWMYRGSLKYRSVEARLLSATSWMPTGADNRDFELAWSEFTDSEDGVFIGTVRGVRIHHCLIENMTDDGVFLTAPSGWDGAVAGGDVRIWQNRLGRCLTTFAFGVGHGRQITLPDRVQTGDGVWIARNIFDFRRPVHYHWPKGPDDRQEPYFRARFGGDHGSPAWEPMHVLHNTIIGGHIERPDFGAAGLGSGMGKGTTRHVLNNILCADVGEPGVAMPKDAARFHTGANILWSFAGGSADAWHAKLQRAAGGSTTDRIADPGFRSHALDWREKVDLALRDDSPAIGAAVALPAGSFDPLQGRGADIGAIPKDAAPRRVGVRGRMDVFGRDADTRAELPPFEWSFPGDHPEHGPRPAAPRALSIRGYPSFDAPILEYLLRRRGAIVESHEKEHVPLTPSLLAYHKVLLYDGSLTRAKVQPDTLAAGEIAALDEWLASGGTLILCFQRTDIFKSEPGRAFLARHLGEMPKAKPVAPTISQPAHPWLRHITTGTPSWLEAKRAFPIAAAKGEALITSGPGLATLWQTAAGRGRIIYIGWSPASQLTDNRRGSTVEADAAFLEQSRILGAIFDDVLGKK